MEVGDLVVFHQIKNARGYSATGEVLAKNSDGSYVVNAYGIQGPGSEHEISDVPDDAIYKPEVLT